MESGDSCLGELCANKGLGSGIRKQGGREAREEKGAVKRYLMKMMMIKNTKGLFHGHEYGGK